MMALLELCLLTMLAPQEPAAPVQPVQSAATAATTDPATWLPGDALAAVVWRATDGETGVADLWQRAQSMDPMGVAKQAHADFRRHLNRAALEIEDLADLLQGGVAAALIGFTAKGQPRFVAVGHAPQRAERVQAALDKLAAANGAKAASVAGKPCQRFDLGGVPCFGGVFGNYLVFATDAATMTEVVAKTQQSTDSSLAAAADWVAAGATADCGGPAQLTVFVRPQRLFAVAAGQAPPEARPYLDRFGTAFQIDAIDRAMLRVRANGQQLRCGASFPLPSETGLLATLLGDASRLTPQMAKAVPPTANEFSFSTLDLGAVVKAALDLVAEIDPNVGGAIGAQIDQLGKRAGTDLRTDLLDQCSGQIVAVRFPEGFGVSFGLRDGARFAQSLAALCKVANLPLEKTSIAGVAARRLDARVGSPTPIWFAVAGNWLCFADGDAGLGALLQQHGTQAADPTAAAALAKAAPGTTMLQTNRRGDDRTAVTKSDGQVVLTSQQTFAGLMGSLAGSAPAEGATQDPAATDPTTTDGTPRASAADVAALKKAENPTEQTPLTDLQILAGSSNAAVAARATWLIAAKKGPESVAALEVIATTSTDAEVRLQAMHGLFVARSVSSMAPAMQALDDQDRRVRTLAAQLLGKLRRPTSKDALLALLSRPATADAGPATDVHAALLALCDMEATDKLLPAATAVGANGDTTSGQALTYYFQSLSPKLTRADEVTLLLAVLDHRDPMLRRYTLGRLSALEEPSTASALEGRLATEGDELRPLVEVALQRVQKRTNANAAAAQVAADGMIERLKALWNELPADRRYMLMGLGAAGLVTFLVFMMAIVRWRRWRSSAESAAATVALVNPSDEYVESLAAEGHELADAADELIEESGDGTTEEDGVLAGDDRDARA